MTSPQASSFVPVRMSREAASAFLALLLLIPSALCSQSRSFQTISAAQMQKLGDSSEMRDSLFSSLQGIVVEASTEESEARIRLTRSMFGGSANRGALTLRAPLDKDTGQSTFASLDGLSGSIAAELSYSQMQLGGPSLAYFWSFSGGAGYKNFEFFERDKTESRKSRETALSFGGAVGTIFLHSLAYLKAKWERTFEENDPVTQCLPLEGVVGFQQCKSLPLGAPAQEERILATMGWRYIGWEHLAIDPQFTFNSKDENILIELPVYLIRDPDMAFTGGLSFGWDTDSNDFVARVFVTQPLGLP